MLGIKADRSCFVRYADKNRSNPLGSAMFIIAMKPPGAVQTWMRPLEDTVTPRPPAGAQKTREAAQGGVTATFAWVDGFRDIAIARALPDALLHHHIYTTTGICTCFLAYL